MTDLQPLDCHIDGRIRAFVRYRNARTALATRMNNVLTDAQGLYDFWSYAWLAGPQ